MLPLILSIILSVVGPQVLVPKPVQYVISEGQCVLDSDSQVKVTVDDGKLSKELRNLPKWSMEAAYKMVITPDRVEIRAMTETGAFYARESLVQMTAISDTLQCCTITDWPRFSHRGLMIDISRNFRDKDFILKQLEAMAMLKMNSLHLHLTDDAGWRIQIDSYPELCKRAAWRIGETYVDWCDNGCCYTEECSPDACGGYLTKEDCREIVDRAAQLHINVIPEIEIPSHSREVVYAYPQFACETPSGEKVMNRDVCPANPEVYDFFETILDEVMEIFPSKIIHIGGDEASRQGWKSCPHCRQFMEDMGYTDVAQLQSHMTARMEEYLRSKGRTLLGWDEILEGGLSSDAVVMCWRGAESCLEPIMAGHDIIVSPSTRCYFDFPQDAPFREPVAFGSYLPLEVVYSYNPQDPSIDENALPHLLGVQGNMWTEYIPTEEHAEYMLYPRAFAIAEIGWTPQEERNYQDFHDRALGLIETFHAKGYNTFNLGAEYGDRYEAEHPLAHLAVGKNVSYAEGCSYDSSYPASGDVALTDGLFGSWAFKDGRWQKFYCDLDVTIDLEKVTSVHYVGATFMAQRILGIAFPAKVEIYSSIDGARFEKCGESTYRMTDNAQSTGDFMDFGCPVNAEARYIRYVARRDKTPGHAALFVDEIVVN